MHPQTMRHTAISFVSLCACVRVHTGHVYVQVCVYVHVCMYVCIGPRANMRTYMSATDTQHRKPLTVLLILI